MTQFEQSTLHALNSAALAISEEHHLDSVLQKIVDAARELLDARYAAISVADNLGRIETFVHSGMDREVVARIGALPQGRGLLGAIIQEAKSIRLQRLQSDARSSGFPPGHPPMHSFLGLPLIANAEVVGNLYLTDKQGEAEFTATDMEMAQMFGTHAAIAIRKAKLYTRLEELAVIEERNRIGMDLHDGVIQSIYAVGLTLESLRIRLHGEDETARVLTDALACLNNVIGDIRSYILDLKPRRFDGDLKSGIEQLSREFEANAMLPLTLSIELDGITPSGAVAQACFLTAQEALANIARHARACAVTVRLAECDGAIELSICDDGIGFEPGEQDATGHGLDNMRARAEQLGGSFTLTSEPHQGTSILFRAPWCETHVE